MEGAQPMGALGVKILFIYEYIRTRTHIVVVISFFLS